MHPPLPLVLDWPHSEERHPQRGFNLRRRHGAHAWLKLGLPPFPTPTPPTAVAPGEGQSDFFEALGVSAGLLAGVEARTVDKRIVLLSNLCSPVRRPPSAPAPALASTPQLRPIPCCRLCPPKGAAPGLPSAARMQVADDPDERLFLS